MKILIVSHTYISSINREKWKVFANKYKDSKIKVLIPDFWPTTLFNIAAGNCFNDNLNNCEFISLKVRKAGNEVLYNYRFIDLYKILKNFKPDLIHVEQGDNAFSYFQLILLSKLFFRKIKFTFFTWINWKNKWSFKYKIFWSLIERFNLKNSSGAFVGNNDAKWILKEKGFLKPVKTLLQLGVNRKFFIPAKKPLESKFFIIGFVGRLIKEKGIFNLIDAFNLLYKKYPRWKIVFVGSGKDENEFKAYIQKLHLDSFVEILSSVKHEDVGDLLNTFDIFILPSFDTDKWREQFGHVLIEAMACKIPIIGSTGGEIPNVIGDSGLIFEQKNVIDLKEKLEMFMKNMKLRKDFALKGYNRFKSDFSYEIIAQETYKFWSKLLEN